MTILDTFTLLFIGFVLGFGTALGIILFRLMQSEIKSMKEWGKFVEQERNNKPTNRR